MKQNILLCLVLCFVLPCVVFAQTERAVIPDDAPASIECANIASAHTPEVRGPIWGSESVAAFLRIYSEDDHSTNSHDCAAEFQLVILSLGGRTATIVPLQRSVGDWGRNLTIHLDGFSPDGKRIFGTISEGGSYPGEYVFAYDLNSRTVNVILVEETSLSTLKAAKCGSSFSVAGTTENCSIVVYPRTAEACRERNRWTIGPRKGELRPLPQEERVLRLYHEGSKYGNEGQRSAIGRTTASSTLRVKIAGPKY